MTRKLTKINSMADRASSWSAPVRELAQRLSGTAEILLVWYPGVDRVELAVSDVTTGERIQIEVAPENAMDAFNHPYAYVAPARAFTT